MIRSHCSRVCRSIASLMLLVAATAGMARADELKLDGRTIAVPSGFTIERIASAPLVDRPITAAFDDEGCLYVADSSGSNDKVEKQLKEKPHRIVRLEDTDGDGKFDRRTVFADRMMFPEGTMWFDGSLYVAAPPSIWKLTDSNGDGVADKRVEWFQGKTLTGCANDLHGPYLGSTAGSTGAREPLPIRPMSDRASRRLSPARATSSGLAPMEQVSSR